MSDKDIKFLENLASRFESKELFTLSSPQKDKLAAAMRKVSGVIEQIAELESTLKKAKIFIDDVMPQIGGLCIQDLGNLNECCMEITAQLSEGVSGE